jgi:hypothetical protein
MNKEERNYGCRYQEISIYGFRSLVMENELLRVTMIIDKGCEIIEFNYKREDLDFVWRTPPRGLKSLKYFVKDLNSDLTLTDYYLGGWYDTFPSSSAGGKYINTTLPIYGEVCYMPWEYEVVKDDLDEIAIRTYCQTIRSPFYFQKIFRLLCNDPTLYIETALENISREKIYFTLAYHPNFGKAFIDDEIEVDLKGCELGVNYAEKNNRFKLGQKGKWPLLKSKEGKDIDLSIFPGPDSGINEVISLNNMEEGRVTLKNRNRAVDINITWDLEIYRHALLWMVRYGDTGYPRYGLTNVLCVMPRTVKALDPAEVMRQKDLIYIKPGNTINTWMNFRVKDWNRK